VEPRQQLANKVEEVCAVYPDQRERIERCAEVVVERGTDALYKAFDKQLQRIAGAGTRQQAIHQIDRMEHTLFESPLLSPFLGAREDKPRQRMWLSVGIGVVCALLLAFVFVFEGMPLLERIAG
jgi:hypothetical protein